MLKRKILSIGICSLFLLIVPGSFNPADSQTLSESKPAPDIGTWTQVPPGHSEVDLKGACMTATIVRLMLQPLPPNRWLEMGKGWIKSNCGNTS